jgi:hypothetical protein
MQVLFLEGGSPMDFRPLNDTERKQLILALRGNAESNRTILMDRRDTSFAGTADEVTDDEVISAIRSVPCHY